MWMIDAYCKLRTALARKTGLLFSAFVPRVRDLYKYTDSICTVMRGSLQFEHITIENRSHYK